MYRGSSRSTYRRYSMMRTANLPQSLPSALPFLRRLRHILAVLLLFASAAATAATATFSVGLDTDNNAATGCRLTDGSQSLPGVEVALETIVTTAANTGTVGMITRRTCSAGVFGPPVAVSAGGWPVAMAAGADGSDLIETLIPLADLAGAAAVKIGAITATDSMVADRVLVLQEPPPAATPVPVLSPLALLALLALVGGTGWLMHRYARRGGRVLFLLCATAVALTAISAAAVIFDGTGADWTGVAPLATDPAGDAAAGQDLVALYAVKDGTRLVVRVDMVLAHDTANQAPTVNAGADQAITLPATASLAGTATDDGLPNPPAHLTTAWSFVSGPAAGVVFGSANALATTASFQAAGTYVLRLTASDGALSSSSDVQVVVNDGAPVFLSVPDRTIELGTRYQQLLVASDTNVGDTLTYSLLAAPGGAGLDPSPLVDWTPTAGQLGSNAFTARVSDAAGHTATTTFHVTVVHTNQPPQLAVQQNVVLPIGTPFARKLSASDPDAGDTLTFALVSGPAGMALAGADLGWPTVGKAAGDYAVTVKVTDAAGLSDQRQFIVTLQPSAAPIAVDDSYEARVGETLVVPAAGVLANDARGGAGTLTATRLTDPGAGTLSAFDSDGGFTYQAPASPPGDPLTVTKLWNASAGSDRYHELAADLDGDGTPDIVSFDNNGGIRARSGGDGSELWTVDNTGATDCRLNSGGGSMDHRVLADIDDSGHASLAQTTTCDRSGGGWGDHIVAYDHLGKLKWVSPPLSKPHMDVRHGAAPVPPGGFTPGGLAWRRGLSVARLTAAGAPVLLLRVEIPVNDAYTSYVDAAGAFHSAGCRAVTGLVADENVACRATLIISGADGSVLQTLVARNPAAVAHFGGPGALSEMPPIAMDIDGDGRVDLVSGTEVWKQNAGGGFDLAWQLTQGVNDTAVADLDGDGKAEIVHLRSSGESNVDNRGIFIYSHDGVLQRRIPLQTYWFTPLTIADVDGDGRSDIVLGADGTVYAFRDDGRSIWAYKVPPDVPSDPVLAPFYTQPSEPYRVANAAPQVYDLDGDGVAEVVFAAHSRIMILDGRSGLRKLDPYWTFNDSYNDVSALLLIDADNDGHVDIVQNAAFNFNCLNPGVGPACAGLVGPVVLSGGGSSHWLPGPKTFPNIQYRSTAIDGNARVLHDTTVSRIFRVPEQQGTTGDPRLAGATSFTYAAGDGAATSAPARVVIAIVPDNKPPVFTSTPPKSLWQRFAPTPPGGLVTNYYDVAAYDPDPGDTITFSLKSAPFWVTMDGPARLRFEPTCGSYGYPCPWGWTTVIVTATDSRGASTDQIFIVNLTTDARTVPDVTGMAFEAANTALLAQDLQGIRWVEAFSAAPVGTVLAQDAVAGAVVGRFDDVRLTVSKGREPVPMPFVVGQPLAAVNALLTGAGLTVDVIHGVLAHDPGRRDHGPGTRVRHRAGAAERAAGGADRVDGPAVGRAGRAGGDRRTGASAASGRRRTAVQGGRDPDRRHQRRRHAGRGLVVYQCCGRDGRCDRHRQGAGRWARRRSARRCPASRPA